MKNIKEQKIKPCRLANSNEINEIKERIAYIEKRMAEGVGCWSERTSQALYHDLYRAKEITYLRTLLEELKSQK